MSISRQRDGRLAARAALPLGPVTGVISELAAVMGCRSVRLVIDTRNQPLMGLAHAAGGPFSTSAADVQALHHQVGSPTWRGAGNLGLHPGAVLGHAQSACGPMPPRAAGRAGQAILQSGRPAPFGGTSARRSRSPCVMPPDGIGHAPVGAAVAASSAVRWGDRPVPVNVDGHRAGHGASSTSRARCSAAPGLARWMRPALGGPGRLHAASRCPAPHGPAGIPRRAPGHLRAASPGPGPGHQHPPGQGHDLAPGCIRPGLGSDAGHVAGCLPGIVARRRPAAAPSGADRTSPLAAR